MDRHIPRGVVALLVAGALLISAAAPLAAATPAHAGTELRTAAGFVDALTAWLAALWPGARQAATPTAAPRPLEVGIEPASQPAAQPQDACTDSGVLPTIQPQVGCEIDPEG